MRFLSWTAVPVTLALGLACGCRKQPDPSGAAPPAPGPTATGRPVAPVPRAKPAIVVVRSVKPADDSAAAAKGFVTAYGLTHHDREALGTLGITYDDHTLLYRGKGCATCSRTGYRGRAGIHELLVATDSMKRLIQGRAPVLELLAAARAEGLTTLVQDGIVKSLDGVTDYKQVKAVAIK